MVRDELLASIANVNSAKYFAIRLSSQDRWRLFQAFKDRAVYLDIETCSVGQPHMEITVVGLYDGKTSRAFINGQNLNDLEVALADYDCVITFNGTLFDLPVIQRLMPHVELPALHIDLRFVLRLLGIKGGLKKIEKQFGVHREPEIVGLDGWDAERLWLAYQAGDAAALETLVAYNKADIVNLEPLMQMAYASLAARCGKKHQTSEQLPATSVFSPKSADENNEEIHKKDEESD